MDYAEAIKYLEWFTNYERALRYPYDGWAMNLERVSAVLAELGSPERSLPVVHIAGSKGKGSTAAMIESMARKAGYKTGLFTSPHLESFRERIRVNGEWVNEEAVTKWVERMEPAVDRVHQTPGLGFLTYFEILTALAFAVFADAEVDLAVVEAGLGGRYDATNVCLPLISVLTPVSMDHTDILGDTLTEIATEKSMIIKEGRPAVIAPQPAEALEVFSSRAADVKAPLYLVEDEYDWKTEKQGLSGQTMELSGRRRLAGLDLSLAGAHQAMNAATAVLVLDLLPGLSVAESAVREGLSSLQWPGRFQRVSERPDLILDGAHNASSAAFLRDTLLETCAGKKVTAVFGLGGDKDVRGFCRELAPALYAAVLTRSRAQKAMDMQPFQEALAGIPGEVRETRSVGEAVELAYSIASENDVIVVTGSFYVISDFLEWRKQRVFNQRRL
ncbi:MAG: folylpolyglutamate synthase/dihydrofolate synthase family protein [bacterium]